MLSPIQPLQDSDGDGFLDSLCGAVWLSDAGDINQLKAAAELVAWLSRDALCLPLDIEAFSSQQPAIYIGEKPPQTLSETLEGTVLHVSPAALLLTAQTNAELLAGARHLNRWPLHDTLHAGAADPALEAVLFQNGLVDLHLATPLSHSPAWGSLPQDLATVTTPTASYVNPHATPSHHAESHARPQNSLSLAHAFRGGALYSGTPYRPETLRGALSLEAPCPDALRVASRLCTEGLQSPRALTGEADHAGVRVLLGDSDAPEIRICDTPQGSVLEVAANSPEALGRAASYFAETFPRLPDGTDLETLEANLGAFLNGETPFARVAMVAALAQQHGARRALLPHPPSTAPRLLGFPVTNTARDGECTHWDSTFAWEGQRFLDTLAALEPDTGSRVYVEGYLSEGARVRETLRLQAKALLTDLGVEADIVLRSAFKPGLCWLLEEVGPRLAQTGAARLEVRCAAHPRDAETEDRWLRELYPGADLLEKTFGVRVALEIAAIGSTYEVEAFSSEGILLFEDRLTPPTHEIPLNGIPELGHAHPTTGRVTVRQGDKTLCDQHLPTDRDLVWQWFTETVLPEVTRRAVPRTPGPFFGELSLVVSASEPDEPLGLDHEHLSATESLHEDFYFGTLEALHHGAGLAEKDRSLAPGRILPFCRSSEARDTRAHAILRAPGSYRCGVIDEQGQTHEASREPFRLRTLSLRLTDTPPHLTLRLELESHEAAENATRRLTWALAHRDILGIWNPFPDGCSLTLELHVEGRMSAQVEVPRRNPTPRLSTLPDRPLLTREVVDYTLQLKERLPYAQLRAPRESLCGAPLLALEFTTPTPASRARLTAWKPTVLLSARQHANEPSSTNAMFDWVQEESVRRDVLKRVNLVFHPLENPDGARLHAALCLLAAGHMHHAARYTGVGADLQTNPHSRGAVIPESDLRLETWRRWRPEVHLNCHGYPAHEWVRAHGGYVPRHFEAWSLPFGYFTILIGTPAQEALLEHLKTAVAQALLTRDDLQRLTRSHIQRAPRYLRSSTFPFVLEQGFPFLLNKESAENQAEDVFAPALTLITEVPDETVSGELWRGCVEAQRTIVAAVVQTLLEVPNAAWVSSEKRAMRAVARTA